MGRVKILYGADLGGQAISTVSENLKGVTYAENVIATGDDINNVITQALAKYNLAEFITSDKTVAVASISEVDGVKVMGKHYAGAEHMPYYIAASQAFWPTHYSPPLIEVDSVAAKEELYATYKLAADRDNFKKALVTLSGANNVSELAMLIMFKGESGLDPSSHNKSTNAVGLNNFIPSTLASYYKEGTWETFKELPGSKQLPYIFDFLGSLKDKFPMNIKLYNFLPAAASGLWDDDRVWAVEGTSAYVNNKAADLNEDGYLTVLDVKAYMIKKVYDALEPSERTAFFSKDVISILDGSVPVTLGTVSDVFTLPATGNYGTYDINSDPTKLLDPTDNKNASKVKEFHPIYAHRYAAAVGECWKNGQKVRYVEVGRTQEQQDIKFASGLSKTTTSKHMFNSAGDVYNGSWKDSSIPAATDPRWKSDIYDIFAKYGLVNPDWAKGWDAPHIEPIDSISAVEMQALVLSKKLMKLPSWCTMPADLAYEIVVLK